MSEIRTQFTFYESFFKAISRIRKAADRAAAYDAICAYALYGTEPDTEKMGDAAAIAFELSKPNLDASRKKAKNGKTGGEKPKQTESKPEANRKQTGSKKEREKENEKEGEKEKEKEYECIPPTPAPRKEAKHKHGVYGWVKLTEDEYNRLLRDLGLAELERCITYVDESAQGSGNKNGWKDWNVVLRKCHREGWGQRKGTQRKQGGGFETSNPFLEMLEERKNVYDV